MITNSYVHIFESIPVGVVVTDLYGYILTMNNYAKSILNITDKSITKEHFLTLLGVQDSLPIENIFHT